MIKKINRSPERLSKNTHAYFTSLENLRTAWGMKPVTNRTVDDNKLVIQQEKFLGTCKVCGVPMSYLHNINVLTCKNPNCQGFKVVQSDGTVFYVPVNKVLDEKGFYIAQTLFD